MEKLISDMNQSEIRAYILEIQSQVQSELSKGTNIDNFLDKTTIFDDFENIIPEAEFGIFVLTILNNYKSEIILEKLVQVIQQSLGRNEDVEK